MDNDTRSPGIGRRSLFRGAAAAAGAMAIAGTEWARATPAAGSPASVALADPADPLEVGSRLQLLCDGYLVGSTTGAAQTVVHGPVRQGPVMTTDRAWEGNQSHYRTVFKDGDIYRMYYLGLDYQIHNGVGTSTHGNFTCYAESTDGKEWTRPNLGLVEFNGSTDNNILQSTDTFSGDGITGIQYMGVFKDANPQAPDDQRYKGIFVANGPGAGLYAAASPDGIHFTLMSSQPLLRRSVELGAGGLDSQNVAFWDAARGVYRLYVRDRHPEAPGDSGRDIKTATSEDFLTWTTPVWLDYPGTVIPDTQLYTEPVVPYYRSPEHFVGFPMRYLNRGWLHPSTDLLPGLDDRKARAAVSARYGAVVTDAVFMSSRDGVTFDRSDTAFIRPGSGDHNWAYGDNSVACGIVPTDSAVRGAVHELSIYATEGYWRDASLDVIRYTMRVDGFGSINAPMSGGTVVTKPLTFEGASLVINFATSGSGSIAVEVLDASGNPIAGLTEADCDLIFGDSIDRTVTWNGGGDLSRLVGTVVQLRFMLRDADVYSVQFAGCSC